MKSVRTVLKRSIFLFSFLTVSTGMVLLFADTLQPQVYQTANGQLRSLRDEDGIFMLNYENGSVTSQVTASEDNLILRVLDQYSRVVREVYWNSDYTEIEKEITYEYNGSRVTAQTEKWWYPAEKRLVLVDYTEIGLKSGQQEYHGSQNAADAVLERETKWTWDENGRCVCEWKSLPLEDITEEVRYIWKKDMAEADEMMFENDELVRVISWESDSRYSETLYFGNGLEVYSEYDNGMQVLERVVSGGKEIRRTIW